MGRLRRYCIPAARGCATPNFEGFTSPARRPMLANRPSASFAWAKTAEEILRKAPSYSRNVPPAERGVRGALPAVGQAACPPHLTVAG